MDTPTDERSVAPPRSFPVLLEHEEQIVQGMCDRDDGEDRRDEARRAREEDGAVSEQGSDPLPDAIRSGDQFAECQPHSVATWAFVHF